MDWIEFHTAIEARYPYLLDGLAPAATPRLAIRHIARRAGFRTIRSWESSALLLTEIWRWLEAATGPATR